MDFTFELGKLFNVMPFDILKQDKDEVIMLLNYMVEKSESAPPKKNAAASDEKQYIKVNNRTATGGWW